ncbi:hypothetical protein Bxe_B0142 [Paraburkholderia xenovorans LB400]|uniref:Uncharacterized protein n=1 Tax=Paraburkholderia xenovorans (strain LB400) TaxID=266265 RepID=Q13JE3_PARXL|nr:hypothetical protein Bxe_B0142 [Paraburkholderia xenovorans LB400]
MSLRWRTFKVMVRRSLRFLFSYFSSLLFHWKSFVKLGIDVDTVLQGKRLLGRKCKWDVVFSETNPIPQKPIGVLAVVNPGRRTYPLDARLFGLRSTAASVRSQGAGPNIDLVNPTQVRTPP